MAKLAVGATIGFRVEQGSGSTQSIIATSTRIGLSRIGTT
jgi:hypothetical protein